MQTFFKVFDEEITANRPACDFRSPQGFKVPVIKVRAQEGGEIPNPRQHRLNRGQPVVLAGQVRTNARPFPDFRP